MVLIVRFGEDLSAAISTSNSVNQVMNYVYRTTIQRTYGYKDKFESDAENKCQTNYYEQSVVTMYKYPEVGVMGVASY